MRLTSATVIALIGAGSTESLPARVPSRPDACELASVVDSGEVPGRPAGGRNRRSIVVAELGRPIRPHRPHEPDLPHRGQVLA